VNQSERYVSHGPLHLLLVPAGSVALCWQGTKALILEFREEPYFFDDPLFKFVEMKPAQTKMITHGSINRLQGWANIQL
jgi:hypothetical protein